MHHPTTVARPANQSLARVLAHAIEAAGKPRHRIANECGMHRETLLRLARGDGNGPLAAIDPVVTYVTSFDRARLSNTAPAE